MRQTWREVTFLHWRYRPSDGICENSARVGLVPFVVLGLATPRAPSIPWLSQFPETNVRTYVADATGRRGSVAGESARAIAIADGRAVK
jgi:uncharacterized protein YqjF (DUF2071 family)